MPGSTILRPAPYLAMPVVSSILAEMVATPRGLFYCRPVIRTSCLYRGVPMAMLIRKLAILLLDTVLSRHSTLPTLAQCITMPMTESWSAGDSGTRLVWHRIR